MCAVRQAVVFCLASKMEVFCVRFPFVFKKLLFNVDDQHLVKLKKASRQVSNHIDDERYYYIRIIQKLFEQHNGGCAGEFPESWKKVIEKTPIKIIKQLAMVTTNFIKTPCSVRPWKMDTLQWHPLHVVAEQGHLELLNHVVEKTGDNNPKLAKGTFT